MKGSYTAIATAGRFNSEVAALYVPRRPDPTKAAIIYAHGANGQGIADWKMQSAMATNYGIFAKAGYVVLAADWGGPQTYGNDTEYAAMDAGWQWLRAQGICRSDKVILTGGSMGMLSISRWAADNETQVAGMNAWIPAINIDDLRNKNALGLRDFINTAWGLPAGSYPDLDGTHVPVQGRPLDRAMELAAIPTHLWYSSGDTATLAADVLAYAAARPNVTTHEVSTVLDHGNPAIAAADINAILAFFQSVA